MCAHLLKKFLMQKFVFSAVIFSCCKRQRQLLTGILQNMFSDKYLKTYSETPAVKSVLEIPYIAI